MVSRLSVHIEAAVLLLGALSPRSGPVDRSAPGYALNTGVTEAELKEVIYPTTVTAGFPKAIIVSQALSELFAERRAARPKGR